MRRKNVASWLILGLIVLGCLCAELICAKDPTYLDLANVNRAPNAEFLFGTDPLGRDIFSGIWHGGQISLCIAVPATLISTAIALLYGTVSGLSSARIDGLLMRFVELLLSVPSLLLVLFVQAMLGEANVLTLALVIGVTGWCTMAKIVRTEVRQLRNAEYILAARCMGFGFFYILRKHLLPALISSLMYFIVMNFRAAIVAEATLSFLGMGLPPETVSWGSMLSLAERALLTDAWWAPLFPSLFLIGLLVCMTNLGNRLRARTNPKARLL